MTIAFVLVAITVAFGVIFYSASVPTGVPLVQFVLTLLVGGLSFAALALALTAAIPNADAAPPIVNASILPLLFLSGIFIPIGDDAPTWIKAVSNIFPVRHFFEAMASAFLGNLTVPTPKGRCAPSRSTGGTSPWWRRGGSSDWCSRSAVLQLGTPQVAALRVPRRQNHSVRLRPERAFVARSHPNRPRSNRGYARCGSS